MISAQNCILLVTLWASDSLSLKGEYFHLFQKVVVKTNKKMNIIEPNTVMAHSLCKTGIEHLCFNLTSNHNACEGNCQPNPQTKERENIYPNRTILLINLATVHSTSQRKWETLKIKTNQKTPPVCKTKKWRCTTNHEMVRRSVAILQCSEPSPRSEHRALSDLDCLCNEGTKQDIHLNLVRREKRLRPQSIHFVLSEESRSIVQFHHLTVAKNRGSSFTKPESPVKTRSPVLS